MSTKLVWRAKFAALELCVELTIDIPHEGKDRTSAMKTAWISLDVMQTERASWELVSLTEMYVPTEVQVKTPCYCEGYGHCPRHGRYYGEHRAPKEHHLVRVQDSLRRVG